MITEQDKQIVEKIKDVIKQDLRVGEHDIDWERVEMLDILDKLVNNLQLASKSFKYCSKEDEKNNFYTAECKCGWWGSSKFLEGGGQIADTGDYNDATCPVCGNADIDGKYRLNSFDALAYLNKYNVKEDVDNVTLNLMAGFAQEQLTDRLPDGDLLF